VWVWVSHNRLQAQFWTTGETLDGALVVVLERSESQRADAIRGAVWTADETDTGLTLGKVVERYSRPAGTPFGPPKPEQRRLGAAGLDVTA
jgi:hypothetical protein